MPLKLWDVALILMALIVAFAWVVRWRIQHRGDAPADRQWLSVATKGSTGAPWNYGLLFAYAPYEMRMET